MIAAREKQAILTMRQQGLSCPEIAAMMSLSPNTVKSLCRRSKIQTPPQEALAGDVCKNCGAPLKRTPGAKKKVFCGDKCRYAWWNRQRSKRPYRLICYQCGKEFISYGNKKRKFCSRECYNLSRYGEGLP